MGGKLYKRLAAWMRRSAGRAVRTRVTQMICSVTST